MSFWLMMCLTFGLVSVATLSPIPLVIVFVAWLLSRPFEKPLIDEVIRTGGNPDSIPNPTKDGYSCLAFIIWLIIFGSMGLVSIAVLLAIVEGKGL
jgi:hypothetical protein